VAKRKPLDCKEVSICMHEARSCSKHACACFNVIDDMRIEKKVGVGSEYLELSDPSARTIV